MRTDKRIVRDAAEGLALEAELFAADGPQVAVWASDAVGLVCPRAYRTRVSFEEACAQSEAAGWPVHLRRTGGGTVPQGPGVDNLALVFDAPKGFTIEDGYKLICGIIQAGFGAAGQALCPGDTPGSFCDGAWNLSVDGQKMVGTAQRWRPVGGGRQRVLAHALILSDDGYVDGSHAVAAFHRTLGLGEVVAHAHTSAAAAFGVQVLPSAALCDAAERALAAL